MLADGSAPSDALATLVRRRRRHRSVRADARADGRHLSSGRSRGAGVMTMRQGWHKIWTIATFEFLTAVKRPGYLITTFGMPLFMAAYAGVVAIPAYFAEPCGPRAGGLRRRRSGRRAAARERRASSQSPSCRDEVKQALEAPGQGGAVERGVHGVELHLPAVRVGRRGARRAGRAQDQGLLRVSARLHREGRRRHLHAGHDQHRRAPSRATRSRTSSASVC